MPAPRSHLTRAQPTSLRKHCGRAIALACLRPATAAIGRVARPAPVSLAVAILGLAMAAPSRASWWWHPAAAGTHRYAIGNPTPPPPVSAASFRQFLRLLAEFNTHFHGFDPHAFRAWVMLRGITDPHEVATMVELYVWFARNRAV